MLQPWFKTRSKGKTTVSRLGNWKVKIARPNRPFRISAGSVEMGCVGLTVQQALQSYSVPPGRSTPTTNHMPISWNRSAISLRSWHGDDWSRGTSWWSLWSMSLAWRKYSPTTCWVLSLSAPMRSIWALSKILVSLSQLLWGHNQGKYRDGKISGLQLHQGRPMCDPYRGIGKYWERGGYGSGGDEANRKASDLDSIETRTTTRY